MALFDILLYINKCMVYTRHIEELPHLGSDCAEIFMATHYPHHLGHVLEPEARFEVFSAGKMQRYISLGSGGVVTRAHEGG